MAGVSAKPNASSEKDCQLILELVKNCMRDASPAPPS